MNRALVIFEDSKYEDFYPLTCLRPVFFLRPGIRLLYEKILDNFPDHKPHFFCRPELASLCEEQTNIPVNRLDDREFAEIIFINGRVKFGPDFARALKGAAKNAFLTSRGNVVAMKITDGLRVDEVRDLNAGELAAFADKARLRSEKLEINISFYEYLWDFVNDIDRSIADDFQAMIPQIGPRIDELKKMISSNEISQVYSGVHFINPEAIYISADAELLPGTVIDATKGPIFIGTRARIEPHTYLIGPAYVGKECILVGGKIAGSSIGSVCRVGGEVEETIIQGYSNKYHAGFLGHSYIGEWVNLGAMTTNSDLKNNYTDVKVSVNGRDINTECLKVGSFIGDFTKTAIGTLLITGINIGVSCNIVCDGLVMDKEIPSFTWYSSRHKMEYNLAKALDTAERTVARRNKKLSAALKKRLAEISQMRRPRQDGTGGK